jgi:hypothetical protein
MELLDCQFWITEMADILLKLAAKKQIRTFEKAKGEDQLCIFLYEFKVLERRSFRRLCSNTLNS